MRLTPLQGEREGPSKSRRLCRLQGIGPAVPAPRDLTRCLRSGQVVEVHFRRLVDRPRPLADGTRPEIAESERQLDLSAPRGSGLEVEQLQVARREAEELRRVV